MILVTSFSLSNVFFIAKDINLLFRFDIKKEGNTVRGVSTAFFLRRKDLINKKMGCRDKIVKRPCGYGGNKGNTFPVP